jgi:hypothetical protein
MKAIKISGNNDKVLSIELKDVLRCIANGNQFRWSILWLEAIGNIVKSMPDFENEIRNSENGLMIEWKDLLELLKKIHQVIEIVLIGDKDISKLKRYSDHEAMYTACEHVAELINSAYWIIHSKDNNSLKALKNNLQGVENI